MPRTRRSLVRIAAIAAVSAALALGSATAASAFGPADITVTPSTTGENQLTAVAVVCPVTSVTALITWTGTDGGAPIVYGPTPSALDAAGEFSDNYFLESFFDRDTDATFALDCRDAGNVSTGTDSIVYHLPTTLATSSAPASLAANANIVATGNCGTAVGINSIDVYVYRQPGNTLLTGPVNIAFLNVVNYNVNVGTATSLGVPAGDSVFVQVFCNTTNPAPHVTSVRATTTAITAAVVAPAAGLADSGVEPAGLVTAAGALLVGAALLLVWRRRLV